MDRKEARQRAETTNGELSGRSLVRCGLVLVCAILSSGVRAAGAEVTPALKVELSPARLELAQGETGRALLVLLNQGNVPVGISSSDYIGSRAVKIVGLEGVGGQELAPGGSISWVLEVENSARLRAAEQIHLRLVHRLQRDNNEKPIEAVEVAKLEVATWSPTMLDDVVEVGTESILGKLEENRPRQIFVTVKNKWGGEIRIAKIDTRYAPLTPDDIMNEGKQYVTLSPIDLPDGGVAIVPGSTRVFGFETRVSDNAPSGKAVALFEVAVEWEDVDGRRAGVALVKHEFEIGVLGLSEILVAVGVPSLLLLPGFLLLTSFLALWKRLPVTKGIQLTLDKTEFAAFSIALSLVAPLIYLGITGRDYRVGYGLRDVSALWLSAVMLGVGAASIIVTVLWTRNHIREAREVKRRFTNEDTPLDVLRKLGMRGSELTLPQVDVTEGNKSMRYLVLEELDGDPRTSWIAPVIQVSFGNETSNVEREKLRERIDAMIGSGDANGLGSLLAEEERNGNVGLKWDARSGRSARLVGHEELQSVNGAHRLIIEFTDDG